MVPGDRRLRQRFVAHQKGRLEYSLIGLRVGLLAVGGIVVVVVAWNLGAALVDAPGLTAGVAVAVVALVAVGLASAALVRRRLRRAELRADGLEDRP